MASGHVNRATGRTHGRTDQACDVKNVLANTEPSTHGTQRRWLAPEWTLHFESRQWLRVLTGTRAS